MALFVGVQTSHTNKTKPTEVVKETLNYEINEAKLITKINTVRIKYGRKTLKIHPLLMKSAQLKANDLIENNYFEHDRLNGQATWIFFEKAGYDYSEAGENLAKNFLQLEREKAIVRAWLVSPKHREVMLSPDYEEIGIGWRENVVVCHFGKREQGVDTTVTPKTR